MDESKFSWALNDQPPTASTAPVEPVDPFPNDMSRTGFRLYQHEREEDGKAITYTAYAPAYLNINKVFALFQNQLGPLNHTKLTDIGYINPVVLNY